MLLLKKARQQSSVKITSLSKLGGNRQENSASENPDVNVRICSSLCWDSLFKTYSKCHDQSHRFK